MLDRLSKTLSAIPQWVLMGESVEYRNEGKSLQCRVYGEKPEMCV